MLIFNLVLAVVEFLAILWLFTIYKLQNIPGTHAAIRQQNPAADFPSLNHNTEPSTMNKVNTYNTNTFNNYEIFFTYLSLKKS
jgi:hypothetical protein